MLPTTLKGKNYFYSHLQNKKLPGSERLRDVPKVTMRVRRWRGWEVKPSQRAPGCRSLFSKLDSLLLPSINNSPWNNVLVALGHLPSRISKGIAQSNVAHSKSKYVQASDRAGVQTQASYILTSYTMNVCNSGALAKGDDVISVSSLPKSFVGQNVFLIKDFVCKMLSIVARTLKRYYIHIKFNDFQ